MKKCFKCKKDKPKSEFYKHSQMKDGTINKCKDCTKKDVSENRADRADYYRAYEKNRAQLPHRVESRNLYAKTEAYRMSQRRSSKKYRERNVVKRKAHIAVGNAIRDGLLAKMPCEVCGLEKVHAHHDDYSKPLEVRWLCPAHHFEWHQVNGEGANANDHVRG